VIETLREQYARLSELDEATMGDAKAFKSGREFAAWLGLVPR
jgi:transposase